MSKKKPRAVPNFDDYFMALCFMIASRSKDPATQCGAIIVDNKHRIQSTGYNGASATIADPEIDWNRPEKYPFVIHAEQNALDNWFGGPDSLQDSTLYITGPPCVECTKRIISRRIRKIIFGPQRSTLVNENEWNTSKEHCRMATVTLERYIGNLGWLRDRLAWMEENTVEVFQPNFPIPL